MTNINPQSSTESTVRDEPSSEDPPAAIAVNGLTKHYGDVVALTDAECMVCRDETFGLVGPNGAGKSTLINLLLGYIEPTGGTAEVLGHDVRSESLGVREHVGILPEGYSMFDRLSGRKHVQFVIDHKQADDEAEELLETVGLSDAADRPAKSYSHGMQQRLAFAMALVDDPPVVILDEPFTALDPDGVHLVRDIVRKRNRNDKCTVLSTHRLEYVSPLCDRLGLIFDGSIRAEGPVEDVRDDLPESWRWALDGR